MDQPMYHALARAGSNYWWNQGREDLITRLLARHGLPGPRRLLDLGCAAGATLAYLSPWGEAWGLDASEEALALCRSQGLDPARLVLGNAENMPEFADGFFTAVTAVDVLEHLHHPDAALREVRRVLKPGGLVLITVPADPRLWSERDVRLRHVRRFTLGELGSLVAGAGFEILKLSYANAFYYWPMRWLMAWRKLAGHDGAARIAANTLEPPRLISRALAALLRLENRLIFRHRLPWGVSAVCVGRVPLEQR